MKTKFYTSKLFPILLMGMFLNPLASFSQTFRTHQTNNSDFLKGTIVIKVKEGIGPFEKQERSIDFGIQSLDEKALLFGVTKLEKRFRHKPIQRNSGLPDLSRIYRIEFSESQDVHKIALQFAKDPNIEYAEAIPIYYPDDEPNDQMYTSQQHLPQIMASEAWDVHKGEDGNEEIIIAVNDGGVDWDHEDLFSNIWNNLGEDADGDGHTMEFDGNDWVLDPGDLNGIDDDANGFIDDLIGWDFVSDDGDPNPHGDDSHGTHCAGIAAASTNNETGIASISWNLSLMPTCINGGLAFWDGIIYAAENGADIISISFGGWNYSIANQEVITYAAGLGSIIVASAGNDNSSQPHYPSDYMHVISVAAVNPDDTRASFSHYGRAVDIAAPGVSILSTVTNNSYARWNGTSMATPMVAGLFGLLKSYEPEWTNDQLIEQIIGTADDIDQLNPGYENALGSGRINAYHALVDENVEVQQELRLEFFDFSFDDDNGNGSVEAGETASISFSMRNYAHLVEDNNATISLISFDPDIEIINGSSTVAIPADSEFEFENIFEFKVSEGAEIHNAFFIIEVASDIPITYGSETEIAIFVAPSGFYVWEGAPDMPDYSGSFINDFLDERGYPVVYTNTFPQSFIGFEAVFLSFGNWGSGNTQMNSFMANTLIEYLTDGGNIYLEGGVVFSYDQVNNSQLLDFFGLASASDGVAAESPIEMLIGQTDAITEDMIFLGSNQASSIWIEKYQPSANGVTAFIEDGYGIVGVQNMVVDAHRTFCFSYTLSKLIDEDPHSSKYNILIDILNFFGFPPINGDIVANFKANNTEGVPDLEVQFTDWSIVENGTTITAWAWDFNEDGEIDSHDQNPNWTYTQGGGFDVSLIISADGGIADTLTKKDLITIRSGILVYEGEENTNGYSGTFINDYLVDHFYDEVSYTNKFPSSLSGYDAVFLSYGNSGLRSTELTNQMSDAIYNYCMSGGKIYIEGGNAISSMNQSNLWVLGMDGSENGESNELTAMIGLEDAITNGLEFNASSQFSMRSIDTYSVYDELPGATAAFAESDYGIVAVQFEGSQVNGQKTFCMSYALADLAENGGLNTRDELLARILNFFDVTIGVEDNELREESQIILYPNPAKDQIALQINTDENRMALLEIFDMSGKLVSSKDHMLSKGVNIINSNISGLKPGIYYFRLHNEHFLETIKWIKVD